MTLILSGTDNSATAPAVQGGTAGTSTGPYFPATNQWAVSTNGTQAMLVDASQNATFAGTIKSTGKGVVQNYDYLVPTTGFSYTFSTYNTLIMNPASILATGTITMPASPSDGMVVIFTTTKAIVALTINANSGQTINNAATALGSGQSISFVYRSASTAWFAFTNGVGNTVYTSASYLIVAGGGGGGGDWSGGGGGGGYLAITPSSLTSGSYSIVVGAGGAGGTASIKGTSGDNSTAFGYTAIGGGGGGSDNDGDDIGRSGGSGGGGAIDGAGGAGTAGQGNNGASGNRGNSLQGGGGGGASQTGQAQAGGNGTAWLNGTYYAGGGGGSRNGSTASGGTGGGGTGANGGSGGSAGTANTGGGGGAQNGGGFAGGSGVVIIRYAGSQLASGGTVTSAGGYTYHTFTTSGTFTT